MLPWDPLWRLRHVGYPVSPRGYRGLPAFASLSMAGSKGALATHERELVALGISIIMQHRKQIRLHVKQALKFGRNGAEIIEVLPIALLMDGAPALSQIPHLIKAIEKYSH